MDKNDEDKKPAKTSGSLWAQIFSLIDSDVRELLNVFLFIAIIPLVGFGGVFLFKFLNNLAAPTTHCWELKEAGETLYRMNACTGELILVEKKPMAPSSNPQQ